MKVLDFGLAKALARDVTATQGISQSPTTTIDATRVGVILGTAPYMSPEQARGLPVDTRADIWSFGCVLYEMLTGRRPFTGETIPETLAAILEREPDWNAFPSSTPSGIRALLRRCLQRDLALRVQNIVEARETIEKAQRGWNRWRVAALSAAVVGTLAVSAAVWWRQPARPADRSEWVQVTQFPDSVIQPALSPDGRMLAFIRSPSGSTPFSLGQVFVKLLPNGEPVQLTNDNLAKLSPVFSPDGSRIAYGTVNPGRFEWDMWTVPALGGEPQPWLRNASGLVWSGPGRILFSEMKKNPHMGIVTARESRVDQRDVYLPAHAGGIGTSILPVTGRTIGAGGGNGSQFLLDAVPAGWRGRLSWPPNRSTGRWLHVRGVVPRRQMDVFHLKCRWNESHLAPAVSRRTARADHLWSD